MSCPVFTGNVFILVTLAFVWRSLRNISQGLTEPLLSVEESTYKKFPSITLFASMLIETLLFVTCRRKATGRLVINGDHYFLESLYLLLIFDALIFLQASIKLYFMCSSLGGPVFRLGDHQKLSLISSRVQMGFWGPCSELLNCA